MKKKHKIIIITFLSALLIVSAIFIHSVIPAKAKTVNTFSNQSFDKLPPGLAPAVAKTFQENLPESYHIKKTWKTYRAENESHGMRYTFTSNGPLIQSADKSWKWGMTLKRWGYEGQLQSLPDAEIMTKDQSIEYTRGKNLTEWYKNTIFGLEQGFTITDRPGTTKTNGSLLALEIAISGTLTPKLNDNTLLLQDKYDETLSRYTGLYAYDSKHRKLPAYLVLADNNLSILVDDTKATYPITIDPWVQKAKLTASDGSSSQFFGKSVSTYTISNKDYVVIGAHTAWGFLYNTGAAYVFEEPDNGWSSTSSPATKLMASDGKGTDKFGFSVDIYHDYIVVGAYTHDTGAGETDAGAAYVFERPGTSWSDAGETMTESIKLTAGDGDRNVGDNFGYSVAAASDVIVVGAHLDDHESSSEENWGAAYVFQKNKTQDWDEITPDSPATKLVQSGYLGIYYNEFGKSVDVASFSSSPDVIVVGSSGESNSTGAAYVFVEPDTTNGWSDSGETTTQTARLTSSDCDENDYCGESVAIDSNTIIIGAPKYYGYCIDSLLNNIGAVFIFEKPVSGWANMTDETARLTAGDCILNHYLGESIAIDGDTIVAGARADNSYTGAAYIFKRPESGWADMTHTFKVTARDGAASDHFGGSVAFHGETAIVGAFGNSSSRGAAYIFVPGSPAMPWMIPLLLN